MKGIHNNDYISNFIYHKTDKFIVINVHVKHKLTKNMIKYLLHIEIIMEKLLFLYIKSNNFLVIICNNNRNIFFFLNTDVI